MTQAEIKTKIADLQKRAKNPQLPASAKAQLEKMITSLEGQLEKEGEKKEEPKKEDKKEDKPKASAPKREAGEKTDADCDDLLEREDKAQKSGYDIDHLLLKARQNKQKSKERAEKRKNEPKKTPATKNKEAVEKTAKRVESNVEKRAEKGKVTKAEIEKLIEEYEDAIKKLKKLLAKASDKMEHGGNLDPSEEEEFNAIEEQTTEPKVVRYYFEDEEYEYKRGGRPKSKHKARHDVALDKNYEAKKGGTRKSEKFARVPMKGGGSYTRRNANQFGKVKGGKHYTEYRKEHVDKKKWL